MATLAYKMFEIQRQFLESILHYKWMHPTSKLAIVGGIQINLDGDKNDHFLPLTFEVRSQNGDIEDCYEKTFNMKSPYLNFKNEQDDNTSADS